MGEPGGVSRAEFDELFNAHFTALHGFARRRLRDPAAVDDVVAETFVVVWRRRAEIPDPAVPWLYGVCLNVISTAHRSETRRRRLWSRLAAEPAQQGRDPAERLPTGELGLAFAKLRPEQREVLRLVAWDGLSAAEGAAALACTEAAFRVRLHRARRDLGKQLGGTGHIGTNVTGETKEANR